MPINVGSTDRLIRLVVAVVALVAAFVVGLSSVGGIILLLVAVVMGGTALTRRCPLYVPMKMNTNK